MVRLLLKRLARDYPTVLATVGTVLVVLVMLFWAAPRAPLELSQATWESIRRVESGQKPYAADILNSARQHYDRAWAEIQIQMQRPLPLRSFHTAEILLIQAVGLADAAEALGRLADERSRDEMIRRVGDLRRDLNHYDRELRHSLKSVSLRSLATQAELKVSLAEQHLADNRPSERIINDAQCAVDELRMALDREYEADAAMIPLWDDWFHETLEWTRKTDSSALLVVKATHCGYLLRGGTILSSFPIELGFRSGQQKMHSGDGATPEGMFRIVARRDTGAAYYRALDLDYPTFSDSIRYEVSRKLGTIPQDVGIGGSIQIHGEGGRQTDWTNGCVAVTNEIMDSLMERLNVGDRVTIVRQLNGWPQ